ncbi:DNA/RNA helicase domain-containing protein [Yinghuangia sp. YIM S10712]|uniref:DNA/RNA helicase domain-containing protein n=1 Tax=Yinghuangia sp. YIM S10712 TaxID=3436930 RepID=UPI003F53B4D4
MLLRMSARTLAEECVAGTLEARLGDRYRFVFGREAGASERRSWVNSLKALADVLNDAGLGSVEAMLEYQLPLTSKRADVVLAGIHPATGRPSYVVVELKQWSTASMVPDNDELCLVPTYGNHAQLHPVRQVAAYCDYLIDFTQTLADHADRLVGVAYLHNAKRADVVELATTAVDIPGNWMFTADERGELLDFLRSRLSSTNGAQAADLLQSSRVAPSRQLMAVAADEVKNREQFVLLDEQRVAHALVMRAVAVSREADSKEVIVVTGGPGSGKSVIALSLLGELARRGRTAVHATGSKSFTVTLRKIVGRGSTRTQKLFQYFNSFTQAERNGLDVLICDEAHRIRETSNNRFTPAARRSGKRQIEELIDAARVPVFLLDEHQVVRPGEMGTVAEIDAAARVKGLRVRHVDLNAQFRCGGSREYEEWVLRLLGLVPGGPLPWGGADNFTVETAESPMELEQRLRDPLGRGYGARMTAGFCWPWSDPRPDATLVDDVVIGDWRRPWNVKGDRSVGDAPPSQLWATDPAGFGQVGCIYTAQGFEYDWNGVIFGPDLVWRTDRWVAVREASRDTVVARAPHEEFEALIRNTYKVLLTRGMVGTVLHSTDAETQAMLRGLIQDGAVTRLRRTHATAER